MTEHAMTDFAHILSAGVMRALGWTLVHFLWQGLALAALGSAVMAVFRSSSVRYLVGLATLLLMLAAPVVTFLLFLHPSDQAGEMAAAPQIETVVLKNAVTATQSITPAEQARTISDNFIPAGVLVWLVQLWFLGIAFFSLRAAGGFLLIERLRRQQAVPMNGTLRERCLVLQRRLGLERVVRYCECQWLQVPAVIGWFRPMVLVPVTAITGLSGEQLEAVIAHELAHVKRWDSVVNLFQIVVETLLFYHPAVWWVNQRIRAERENCCDDAAVAICGDRLQYARALTLLAEARGTPSLALAANGSPLAVRIARLLGLGKFERRIRSAGIAASVLCLTAALMAGNAFLGIAHAASDSAAASRPALPVSDNLPATTASNINTTANKDVQNGVQENDVQNNVLARNAVHDATSGHPSTPGRQAQMPANGAPQTAEPSLEARTTSQESQDSEKTGQSGKTSYIDGLKAVGLNDLSVDQLIAMKIHGVTPEYVRGLQQQGMHPDANQLIGLKIQGVTPEYVRGIRATGLDPAVEQLIGMRIQGVTPEFIKALQSSGLKLKTDDVIAAKIMGITPEFIEKARSHGFKDLDLNKLIALKHSGVL